MAIDRYNRVEILIATEGQFYATPRYITTVRDGLILGEIPYEMMTFSAGQRLDHLAAQYLGDSSLWWVIAAASDIGWGLQVPAGAQIRIPTDLSYVLERIG